MSTDNNVIVFLNKKNDILDKDNEEFEFNFADLSTNVKPYINLITNEMVDINIKDQYTIIKDSNKKKIKLFFCTKEFTNMFGGDDKSDSLEYFYETKMSKDILQKFNEIKKIAIKFGKIYFTCKDGVLYIESTDKTNSFCNNASIEFDKIDEGLDFSLLIDFKNLSYILNTVESEIDDFTLKCVYIKESESGMILFEKEGEKYFILSKDE